MDVGTLLMRAITPGMFSPLAFAGGWTPTEQASIRETLAPHVSVAVDSMYNFWEFYKWTPSQYYIKRATWENGHFTDSVAGCIEYLKTYYA